MRELLSLITMLLWPQQSAMIAMCSRVFFFNPSFIFSSNHVLRDLQFFRLARGIEMLVELHSRKAILDANYFSNIWCTCIVVIQRECLREVLDVVTQTSSCRGWHIYICQLRVCNSLLIPDKKVYLQPIARTVCCTFVMVLTHSEVRR